MRSNLPRKLFQIRNCLVRTQSSHWVISLSEKDWLRFCEMDSDSDNNFKIAALALVLVQRSRRSRLCKQNGRFRFRIFVVFESSMASSISYCKKFAFWTFICLSHRCYLTDAGLNPLGNL